MSVLQKNIAARRNERGFSLLELLLVVGVGALLLLAGIATYRLVTQGNNVNDAVRILATLKQQVQRAFQGQSTYGTGDITPTLVNLNGFPSGVYDPGTGNATHPWNDTILITGATTTFTIQFTQVPSDACIQLGTTFNENDSDFVSLQAGGSTFDAATPVTVAGLTTACGAGGNVDMIWTFF